MSLRDRSRSSAPGPKRSKWRRWSGSWPARRGSSRTCVVTAQHRQMLDQVLDLFDISPDVDLNLMQPNQTLAELTAEILTQLDPVLSRLQPDWVLVQGDTTTVMAAALLAYYHRIHVGHVEAGLRTGDKWQPFPEEINRRIAGVVADLHFAPTEHTRQNLLREGVPDWRIAVTGNPVIDALHQIVDRPAPPETSQLLERLSIRPGGRRLVLVTAHRRENFGQPLEGYLPRRCAAWPKPTRTGCSWSTPCISTPTSRNRSTACWAASPTSPCYRPLDYLPMVHLMKRATLVLTDSGGIQEEATSLGIPTLVLREVTERPEGVEAGRAQTGGHRSRDDFQRGLPPAG